MSRQRRAGGRGECRNLTCCAWAWQGGPPPEKQITLAGIQGPRLGRRDGSEKDQPFAWAAREFVRLLTVGKPCTFEIEESAGNRVFGHINVEGENLASKIVAAGWAKVKAMGNNGNGNANANGTKGVHAAYIEELLQVNPKPQALRPQRQCHRGRLHRLRPACVEETGEHQAIC